MVTAFTRTSIDPGAYLCPDNDSTATILGGSFNLNRLYPAFPAQLQHLCLNNIPTTACHPSLPLLFCDICAGLRRLYCNNHLYWLSKHKKPHAPTPQHVTPRSNPTDADRPRFGLPHKLPRLAPHILAISAAASRCFYPQSTRRIFFCFFCNIYNVYNFRVNGSPRRYQLGRNFTGGCQRPRRQR